MSVDAECHDLGARNKVVRQFVSQEDSSVNWALQASEGILECRYVRRSDDYFVAYLSSQTGCRQGCRMCHLTASGQTQTINARADEFLAQARVVLDWYSKSARRAEIVHFNFMARGEPMANPVLLRGNAGLFSELAREAEVRNLVPKFLISTIFPRRCVDRPLWQLFRSIAPEFYYSLYSVNKEFRRKWLPAAMDVDEALRLLSEWQRVSGKIPKVHYPFIAGENDSVEDVRAVCEAIQRERLRVDLNIVRYNPFGAKLGVESSDAIIERNVDIVRTELPEARVNVVRRIGFDVKASCGMFVNGVDL